MTRIVSPRTPGGNGVPDPANSFTAQAGKRRAAAVVSNLARYLNFGREPDDLWDVTINEELIQDVFSKVNSADLEQVLTAIEGYRVCVATLDRLGRTPHLRQQRKQVMECAESCERALVDYAATGYWKKLHYPPTCQKTDLERVHFLWFVRW